MPTARGPMDVNMQPEPPFLEENGVNAEPERRVQDVLWRNGRHL